jgi:phosphoribosylformimino-5-aminoimidazole carboxamide ribotide isomerase
MPACAFPGHIIVGLDAKDGKVAVEGWSKLTGHDVVDLAKKFEDYGVEVSDLHRHRPRRHALRRQYRGNVRWRSALRIPVIASGGMGSLKRCRGALRWSPTASSARSPAGPFTRARSTSPKAQARADKAVGE